MPASQLIQFETHPVPRRRVRFLFCHGSGFGQINQALMGTSARERANEGGRLAHGHEAGHGIPRHGPVLGGSGGGSLVATGADAPQRVAFVGCGPAQHVPCGRHAIRIQPPAPPRGRHCLRAQPGRGRWLCQAGAGPAADHWRA
ncbi:putative ss-DNA-specific exonuclease RecJ-like protein [Corchorus olitorius]|uniref:Ss-DNA-specific exonuclease RecJ-like protein n=1 Tax=Corchorus olitorius TaxID=93759 RepID=A0A1R3L414_9ROSI|nr:putative ss-DNA-specific exonuclease RecJ-like protein [Corchorus olitorius]